MNATNDKRPLQASRVLCVYENHSLSTASTFAVPRLVSQLLEHFAANHPGTEFIAVSPTDGKIPGVRNLTTDISFARQLHCRAIGSRFARSLRIPRGAESTVPYQRARTGMRKFESSADEKTVVICVTFTSAILARQLLPKARIIYWIHSLPRMGQENLALDAINAADIVATPSQAIYRDLFDIVCRNRFTPPAWVIPNCIDEDQFKSVAESRKATVRKNLGLTEDDLAIVHVGRAPEKGLQVINMALSLCKFNSKNIVLVSVGGKNKGRRRVGPHAEILETGRLTPAELNEIYQVCDLGVIPSVWWENCPLALLEMMSLGLCTIGSRVGGIPEMITHGENGILVDSPNDVRSWATIIDETLSNNDLRQRMGTEARKSVDGRFSKIQYMNNWETLLNTIVPHEVDGSNDPQRNR